MLQQGLPISDLRGDDDELGALLVRARSGSAAAFDRLAERIQGRVRLWAGRLATDDDDAEDIAQLVLLRLHKRMREFEGRSRFTTWLYRMTRNVALSRKRVDSRRARLLRLAAQQPVDAADPPAVNESDTARIAYLVRFCSEALPGRQRSIFEMADLRGVSVQEIADRLGVKPVTVRVSLLRARRAIRLRMLEEHPWLLEEFEP